MIARRSRRLAVCLAATGIAACSAPADTGRSPASGLDSYFETDTLIVEADDGTRHRFDVYLATDYEQQRRGLMFVREMAPNRGMLFVYGRAERRSMWMKNTYLSLDMIFARRDGTVSSIAHDTEPLSLATISSTEPVAYVLELNAGTARRLNIGRNSRIIRDTAD